MANTAFVGLATSLSTKFYMRNFYQKNKNAGIAGTRSEFSNTELCLADGIALRRAVKRIGASDYAEEKGDDIRNSVLAFIETHNNALSSTSDSEDSSLTRYSKQLKNLAKTHSDELDKIGITVNADGSMTSRESLFKTASLSKFKSLFSRESDFMQRSSSLAKRISRRSEDVDLSEKRRKLDAQKSSGTQPGASGANAVLPAFAIPQADATAMTGIGGSVDISL